MYQEDYYDVNCVNDYDEKKENKQNNDKGYNTIRRTYKNKTKSIDIFTSGGVGTKIRDAETGHYTNFVVGSENEDLFYKVALATGECKSKNGSNTLFYLSPQHFMNHMKTVVHPKDVLAWEEKRNTRLRVLQTMELTY